MKKVVPLLHSALVLLCAGCTPKAVAPTTPAIPDDPGVMTDWSRLTPYQPVEAVYTRRYEAFTDTLIPAADYGPLVPFLGDKLGGDGYDGGRYGLVTLTGEIVVDPVFSRVWSGSAISGLEHLPYLLLTKGATSSSMDEWPEQELWAMAALDGSWCTEFKYTLDSELLAWGCGALTANGDKNGIFALDGGMLVYLDGESGKELLRVEAGEYGSLFYCRWFNGVAYYKTDSYEGPYTAFDSATGGKSLVENEEVERLLQERYEQANPEGMEWGAILFRESPEGEITVSTADGRVLAEGLPAGNLPNLKGYDRATGEKYIRLPSGNRQDLYDENGAFIGSAAVADSWNVSLAGGMLLVETRSWSGLYDATGNWIFRYPLPTGEWD